MKKKGKISSYDVFMSFVAEAGDASGILSRRCYDKWVSTRKATLKQPEESFRRVLTAHVCGLIGRKPFPADIEASLLRSLRRKQVWPCFQESNVTIGIKGFRKAGFHENRRGIFGPNASSSLLSISQQSTIATNTLRRESSPQQTRRSSEVSVPLIDVPQERNDYEAVENVPDLSFQGAKRALFENGGMDSLFQTVKRLRTETTAPGFYNQNIFLAPSLLHEVQLPVQSGKTQVQVMNNNGWPLVYGDH